MIRLALLVNMIATGLLIIAASGVQAITGESPMSFAWKINAPIVFWICVAAVGIIEAIDRNAGREV